MKHQDFRNVAVDEAFAALEGRVLPSLTLLIEAAAVSRPGVNAATRADELRALAHELDSLTALFESGAYAAPAANPFSAEA